MKSRLVICVCVCACVCARARAKLSYLNLKCVCVCAKLSYLNLKSGDFGWILIFFFPHFLNNETTSFTLLFALYECLWLQS